MSQSYAPESDNPFSWTTVECKAVAIANHHNHLEASIARLKILVDEVPEDENGMVEYEDGRKVQELFTALDALRRIYMAEQSS